ncbi:MAG: hypothetical protein JWN79_3580 [Gemmatimonadetes bacterium]|jgi:hypothetical protein|nr:hypothetical protein [Gemmatimonadota bacterium]
MLVFEGTYDAKAALAVVDEALRTSPPALGLLLDLSASASLRDRSSDDLRGVATFLSSRRAMFGSRLATVGLSDLAYGLLRMVTVFASEHGIENEAFRSRDEAVAWLCGAPGDQDRAPA